MSPRRGIRQSLGDLMASITVRISVSIALISATLITVGGYFMLAQIVRHLREANEQMLVTRMAFMRDDIIAASFDVARDGAALMELNERRVHRFHAALFDDENRLLARSTHFPEFVDPAPGATVSAAALSKDMTTIPLEKVREQYSRMTSIRFAKDGRRYRTLFGSVGIPVAGGADRPVVLALAIETTPSTTLRQGYQRDLLGVLVVALAVSILLGVLVARRIVVGVKRLGVAAARIDGAGALDARLSLDGTPTELVDSTLAFNRMLERLQLSFERLSAFSSDLAHDLRTPINNLMGEAQVALSRTRTADEYRTVLESAVEEYERMSRMIGNMLFLARADNEQTVVAREPIELREALERVRSYFEQVAEERHVGIDVDVDPAARETHLRADETMLIRALSNLVSNAVRHATAGSRVCLVGRFDGDGTCRIAVSNDGPPIAEASQSRIFERFYRGNEAREHSSSSSGLGLAIVRSIMDLHGGTASVDSGPGRRTTFRLTFPPS